MQWQAVGRRVAKRRRAADLTQHELAARAKVHRNTIAALEAGRLPGVKCQTVNSVARALRCTMGEILNGR